MSTYTTVAKDIIGLFNLTAIIFKYGHQNDMANITL